MIFTIQVFHLIEAIEMIVWHHLNVPCVHAVAADTNHRGLILATTLSSKPVLEL